MSEPVRLHPAEVDAIARRLLELLRAEGAIGAPPAAGEMLTAAEVARRFGVDRPWVYAHADELGAVRLGDGAKPRLRFAPGRVAQVLRARPPAVFESARVPAVDVSQLAPDPLGVLPDRWRAAVDGA
jgi:hypothetical protein